MIGDTGTWIKCDTSCKSRKRQKCGAMVSPGRNCIKEQLIVRCVDQGMHVGEEELLTLTASTASHEIYEIVSVEWECTLPCMALHLFVSESKCCVEVGGVDGAYNGKSDKERIWSKKSCWLLLNGGGAGAGNMGCVLGDLDGRFSKRAPLDDRDAGHRLFHHQARKPL